MGEKLLAGEAEIIQCVGYSTDFILKVNDTDIPLGDFTRRALINVVLGFVKSLKGGEDARKIRLEFE